MPVVLLLSDDEVTVADAELDNVVVVTNCASGLVIPTIEIRLKLVVPRQLVDASTKARTLLFLGVNRKRMVHR